MNIKYVWIDPPSGWKYGFPRKLSLELKNDKEFSIGAWLVDNGYPMANLDKAGNPHWIRVWDAE